MSQVPYCHAMGGAPRAAFGNAAIQRLRDLPQLERTYRLPLVNACLLGFVLCLAVVAFLLWLVV